VQDTYLHHNSINELYELVVPLRVKRQVANWRTGIQRCTVAIGAANLQHGAWAVCPQGQHPSTM
jgi:hypothetical protein